MRFVYPLTDSAGRSAPLAENVQPGDWVAGPFWEAAVQVVGLETRDGYDVVTVAGRNQEPARTCVITPTDWEQITRSARADRCHIRFSGDASRFRLGIQAHRLRLNASQIDPYLRQTEAVQSRLLTYDLEKVRHQPEQAERRVEHHTGPEAGVEG